MDNLDEFMQHKFESDNPAECFNFQEIYWEEAQRLIEAAEAEKKKRRVLFFWWSLLGICLFVSALGLWQTGTELWHKSQPVPVPAANNPVFAQKEEKKATEGVDQTAVAQLSAIQLKQKEIKNSLPTQNLGTSSISSHSLTAPKSDKTIAFLAESNAPKAKPNLFAKSNTNLPGSQNAADFKIKDAPINQIFIAAEPVELPSITSAAEILPNTIVANLPLKTLQNTASEQITAPPTLKNATPIILKPLSSHFMRRTGVEAGLAYYPNGVNDRHWGFQMAGFIDQPFARHWSVQAGIAYRMQPLEVKTYTLDPVSADQQNFSKGITAQTSLHYSFGYTSTTTQRSMVAMHYLELPVALNWQYRALSVRLGLTPGYLVANTEKVMDSMESSLTPLQSSERKRLTTKTAEAYRRFMLSGFAALECALPGGWRVFVRPQYRFSNTLKVNKPWLGNGGIWSLDAGVRYMF